MSIFVRTKCNNLKLTVEFAVFSTIEYLSNFKKDLFFLVQSVNIIMSIIFVFTFKQDAF